MKADGDYLETEDEMDRLDAEYDLDFSMCIEAELLENVNGLADAAFRWIVLDSIVDSVAGRTQPRMETSEAAAYLRFLIAQGATHSWDDSGCLLLLDLPESGASFGPGKPGDVVAESFVRWQATIPLAVDVADRQHP
ncbi:MAG: hypothetical protein EPN79_15670 [Burkholderiaceae bacterium]|nr:MAG: hypothetical protein EPN79_15670 [Burkholderiaceae bacterium]